MTTKRPITIDLGIPAHRDAQTNAGKFVQLRELLPGLIQTCTETTERLEGLGDRETADQWRGSIVMAESVLGFLNGEGAAAFDVFRMQPGVREVREPSDDPGELKEHQDFAQDDLPEPSDQDEA